MHTGGLRKSNRLCACGCGAVLQQRSDEKSSNYQKRITTGKHECANRCR